MDKQWTEQWERFSRSQTAPGMFPGLAVTQSKMPNNTLQRAKLGPWGVELDISLWANFLVDSSALFIALFLFCVFYYKSGPF